jgi:starch synthase
MTTTQVEALDASLKILILAAEMVPFAKTGGLADVIGALPQALQALGHDVRVAMPHYGRIDAQRFGLSPATPTYAIKMETQDEHARLVHTHLPTLTGAVPVYMVENAHYFERDGIYMFDDDADRFIFFCRAALEGIRQLDWQPDVIHCHDWHTAIVPNWLKTIYRNDPFFGPSAAVYTIHNLAYQGVFGHRILEIAGVDELGFLAHPDLPQLNDVVDFMGRGIYYADSVTTVSPTYANEILTPEFGEGLDPLLRDRRSRLFGILNGIDVMLNNPATDFHLAAHYHRDQLHGKTICKADLQREAGLPMQPNVPLIAAISRLTDHKGFDLIDAMVTNLLRNQQVQLIILGTGHQRYHERLSAIRARFPKQLALFFTFKAALTQKIYAGADMFLMPSRFEPCGLGQMIAMRYGTIPIVRATGGLADTVSDFDPATGNGNGFSFMAYDPLELYATIIRAIETYRSAATWKTLMREAMSADHSWEASARQYTAIYRQAIAFRRAPKG